MAYDNSFALGAGAIPDAFTQFHLLGVTSGGENTTLEKRSGTASAFTLFNNGTRESDADGAHVLMPTGSDGWLTKTFTTPADGAYTLLFVFKPTGTNTDWWFTIFGLHGGHRIERNAGSDDMQIVSGSTATLAGMRAWFVADSMLALVFVRGADGSVRVFGTGKSAPLVSAGLPGGSVDVEAFIANKMGGNGGIGMRAYAQGWANRALTDTEAQTLANDVLGTMGGSGAPPAAPSDPDSVTTSAATATGMHVAVDLGAGGGAVTGAQIQVRTPPAAANVTTGWTTATGGTVTDSGADGTIEADLTGLQPATQYDVCAIVQGPGGNSNRVMAAPTWTANTIGGGAEVPPEPAATLVATFAVKPAAAGVAGVRGTVFADAGNGRIGAKLFDFGYTGATVTAPAAFASALNGQGRAVLTIAVPAGVTVAAGPVKGYLETDTLSTSIIDGTVA